jgi:hypothetical protein
VTSSRRRCPFCFATIWTDSDDVSVAAVASWEVLGGGLGSVYYDNMTCMIDRYVELGTADRVCFVGRCAAAAKILPMLAERYCLTKPTTLAYTCRCQRHHADEGSSIDETFPLQFSKTNPPSPRYDKIILFNSLQNFDDLPTGIVRIMKSLSDNGILLIVQRPASLNTLPVPQSVLARLRDHGSDVPMERIISTVQALGLDFRWEMEDVRVVMSRRDWINLLMVGFPLCEMDPEQEEAAGAVSSAGHHECEAINDLMTGIMRYAGSSDIEFTDRLLVVTITRHSPSAPSSSHIKIPPKVKVFPTTFGPLEMEVTREVKAILDERQNQPKRRR